MDGGNRKRIFSEVPGLAVAGGADVVDPDASGATVGALPDFLRPPPGPVFRAAAALPFAT